MLPDTYAKRSVVVAKAVFQRPPEAVEARRCVADGPRQRAQLLHGCSQLPEHIVSLCHGSILDEMARSVSVQRGALLWRWSGSALLRFQAALTSGKVHVVQEKIKSTVEQRRGRRKQKKYARIKQGRGGGGGKEREENMKIQRGCTSFGTPFPFIHQRRISQVVTRTQYTWIYWQEDQGK